jgi:hypothetical protein
MWYVPNAGRASMSRASAAARCGAYVGDPVWSFTTRTGPRFASSSIVSGKFLPCGAYTQAVRTT